MSIYVKDADGNRTKVAGIGLPGPAGKSAYQYAVEGGFSGTEDEFRALMGVRSNQNLLDNWYFADPVNQKGQTVYQEGGYTIDGWYCGGGLAVSVESGWLKLNNSSAENKFFIQKLEPELMDNVAGNKTALSFLYKITGASSQFSLRYFHDEKYINVAFGIMVNSNGQTGLCVAGSPEIPSSKVGWQVLVQVMPGSTLYLKAVKLELGPVQTLAHKEGDTWVLNDPPPDKALELLKCQRYMFVIRNTSGVNPGVGWGVANDSSTMSIDIPVPISMRAVPSVEMSGSWFLLGLGLSFEAESHTIYTRGYSQNTVSTAIAGFSGLEVGKAVSLIANNDPSAKIILDANL